MNEQDRGHISTAQTEDRVEEQGPFGVETAQDFLADAGYVPDHPDRAGIAPAEIDPGADTDVDTEDLDPETPLSAESRVFDELAQLYVGATELQREFTDLEQRGSLTVVAGLPAAGKSTLAAQLVEETGALLIDKDQINPLEPELAARLGTGRYDRDSRDYHAAVAPATRAMLRAAIKAALDGGLEVVVDAPLLGLARQSLLDSDWGLSFAERIRQWLGIGSAVPVEVIWVTADSQTRRARMRKRASRRDSAKLADWDAYDASLGALRHERAPQVLTAGAGRVVDTSQVDG